MSVNTLLAQLTASISSASNALPRESLGLVPADGISLLDVKSELLVDYLQSLVLLVLFTLRDQHRTSPTGFGREEIVSRLVQLRLYLEKGIRPLEGRMKYQIDKVIRAADMAAGAPAQTQQVESNGTGKDEDDADDRASSEEVDELNHRPNLASFGRALRIPDQRLAVPDRSTGFYRPPRLAPTMPPTQKGLENRQLSSVRPQRSRTIDNYIDTEMSSAPVAEPSIGSTIVAGGRHTKSDKERREESERTSYEEANFTRLAPPSKSERAQKVNRLRGGFGGEDLRGLGEGLDRIDRLTTKRRPPAKGKGGAMRPQTIDAKRRKLG